MLIFGANVVLGCILQTWGYNNSGRSILVGGILMHFLSNAAMIFTNGIFELYSTPPLYGYIQVGLNLLAVALIVVIWKPATLNRGQFPTALETDPATSLQ